LTIRSALRGEISSGDILTLSMLYTKAAQPLAKMHGVVDGMHESVIKIGALSAVSHSCACIGSPCLRHCVHGASIGAGAAHGPWPRRRAAAARRFGAASARA
jgi:hypothetical protein